MNLIEVVEKILLEPMLRDDLQTASVRIQELHVAEISLTDRDSRLKSLHQQIGQTDIALKPSTNGLEMRYGSKFSSKPRFQAHQFKVGSNFIPALHGHNCSIRQGPAWFRSECS